MFLHLQKYNIELQYKRGNEMNITDVLSWAYPKNSVPKLEEQLEFCLQVEDIVLSEHLPIPSESIRQFCNETAKDQSLRVLV